jgi:hypothetical protein
MSENMGASTSRNPKDLHGLYRDNFAFTYMNKSARQRNTAIAALAQDRPLHKHIRNLALGKLLVEVMGILASAKLFMDLQQSSALSTSTMLLI